MHLRNPNAFFLELKVRGERRQLPISLTDNQQTILKKLQKIYPNCLRQKQELMEKIEQQIQVMSQQTHLSVKLRDNIKRCIDKIFVNPEEKNQQAEKEVARPTRMRTCMDENTVVPVKEKTRSSATQTQNTPRKYNKSTDVEVKSDCQRPVKSLRSQQGLSKLSQITIKTVNDIETSPLDVKVEKTKPKIKGKKNCNPDIVKACEMIMKKHAHSDMKTMAKEFLKEKGYLNAEKEMVKRKKNITEVSEPVIMKTQQNISKSTVQQRQTVARVNRPVYMSKVESSHLLIGHNRYKYLESSMEALKNRYEERQERNQSLQRPLEVFAQKKYRYLDD